ncbi:sensor histidine kinase [Pseudomonas songnenensis]|uniref:sensor histidine kinase n=1 Tax=Pseudomonas songnenensis TaxID=1176259 RepID=UPI0028AF9347|nr:ATP-binding protein [Pseudomonas songnenensis]
MKFLTRPSADPLRPLDTLALTGSLELFRQLSSQLGASEDLLRAHVDELEGRLAEAGALRRQELEEKERLAQRLQNVLDLLPGGVIVIDGQGVVRDANPVGLELLGEPLVGAPWRDVIARCFAPRKDDGHEVSLRNGRRLSIATRSLSGEPGQLVLLTDLTETRRLQDQLARHERLSSLGRMVASLAHQIRTPLSTALLYASHLELGGLNEEQQRRFAGSLKARLHELEHQVRDMLVFARGDLPLNDRLTPVELMGALRSAAESPLQGVAVRWQCDVHGGEILCNRDTLIGALLNLVENALQACEGERRLKIHLYCREQTLRVCISDNGKGVDADILARLGEPFFTTRATGTGLGLAVAKAVARAHRGELQLRSRAGRGTCASVKLPLIPVSLNPGRS